MFEARFQSFDADETPRPQIAERVAAHPDEAAALLPLLSIALRSLRAPERRAALAALVRAVDRQPALAAAVAESVPELRILDDAAAARASQGAG